MGVRVTEGWIATEITLTSDERSGVKTLKVPCGSIERKPNVYTTRKLDNGRSVPVRTSRAHFIIAVSDTEHLNDFEWQHLSIQDRSGDLFQYHVDQVIEIEPKVIRLTLSD
jgi:hypothetical protein